MKTNTGAKRLGKLATHRSWGKESQGHRSVDLLLRPSKRWEAVKRLRMVDNVLLYGTDTKMSNEQLATNVSQIARDLLRTNKNEHGRRFVLEAPIRNMRCEDLHQKCKRSSELLGRPAQLGAPERYG